jgi:phosphate transport system permease protein
VAYEARTLPGIPVSQPAARLDHVRPSAVRADRAFTVLAWLLGALGFLLPASILGYLAVEGLGRISWTFLTQPPAGFPLGTAGGIAPAITGSLALVALGLSVALPFGVAGAIALSEYTDSDAVWSRAARFGTECLAAVPAIIYGIFGYTVLVVHFGLGASLLAGGLTLGLMMLPIVLTGAYAALRAVEGDQREAALSLGVNRLYVIRHIVLPKAMPGILAVAVLAAGHAVGSAAPVMFTASVAFAPTAELSLDAPVMTLPTHLYYVVSEATDLEQAYGAALILVAGLLCSNGLAMVLRRWLAR